MVNLVDRQLQMSRTALQVICVNYPWSEMTAKTVRINFVSDSRICVEAALSLSSLATEDSMSYHTVTIHWQAIPVVLLDRNSTNYGQVSQHYNLIMVDLPHNSVVYRLLGELCSRCSRWCPKFLSCPSAFSVQKRKIENRTEIGPIPEGPFLNLPPLLRQQHRDVHVHTVTRRVPTFKIIPPFMIEKVPLGFF